MVGALTSAPDTARALRECDALVHTAAPVALAASAREARRVARENVLAIRRLVERALESGIERVVHLSSTTVFDTRGLARAAVARLTRRRSRVHGPACVRAGGFRAVRASGVATPERGAWPIPVSPRRAGAVCRDAR